MGMKSQCGSLQLEHTASLKLTLVYGSLATAMKY